MSTAKNQSCRQGGGKKRDKIENLPGLPYSLLRYVFYSYSCCSEGVGGKRIACHAGVSKLSFRWWADIQLELSASPACIDL